MLVVVFVVLVVPAVPRVAHVAHVARVLNLQLPPLQRQHTLTPVPVKFVKSVSLKLFEKSKRRIIAQQSISDLPEDGDPVVKKKEEPEGAKEGLSIRIDAPEKSPPFSPMKSPMFSPSTSSSTTASSGLSTTRTSLGLSSTKSSQLSLSSKTSPLLTGGKVTPQQTPILNGITCPELTTPHDILSQNTVSQDTVSQDTRSSSSASIPAPIFSRKITTASEKRRESGRHLIARTMSADITPLYRHAKQRKQEPKTKGKTRLEPILIVEDNFTNAKLLTDILRRIGFIIITHARDGTIAVQKCKECHYKLIFMDIEMDPMDGIEATKQIRLNGKNTKTEIVWQSANLETLAQVVGMPYSNNKINKTYDIDEIRMMMHKLIPADETEKKPEQISVPGILSFSTNTSKVGPSISRVSSVPEFGRITNRTDVHNELDIQDLSDVHDVHHLEHEIQQDDTIRDIPIRKFE